MRWRVSTGEASRQAGDLLIIPVTAKDGEADLAAAADLLGRPRGLSTALRRAGFRGASGTHLPWPGGEVKAAWVLFAGLGPARDLSLAGLRHAAAAAARQARAMRIRTVLVAPLAAADAFDAESVVRCWVEGAELGLSVAGPGAAGRTAVELPGAWRILVERGEQAAAARRGVQEGEANAAGCLEARRLVNLPPNRLTPRQLAAEARRLGAAHDLKCTVLGPPALRRLGLGGLLGVGQGSREPSQLICLESTGAPRGAPTVALVGKGVTFDTGGISLKPSAKLDIMKCDMAGAAAVLGAALIVARRRLPVRLLAVVPAAENMPDGGAIRPADVLTLGGGRTVEVVNTDAEGRLILADALHWACGRRPDHVIDIATLTGACALALGQEFAGVMGTSGELIDTLEQAGGETGERVWPLPLIDAHREAMRSTVADLKNLGPREGGALTAAAFLAHFVPDDIAWAHVDMAGPAWAEQDGPLGPAGGTGFGARLLARTVELLVGR